MKKVTVNKEKLLKKISKDHLMAAFTWGKLVGDFLRRKKFKKEAIWLEKLFRKQAGFELTISLRRGGVLPLKDSKRKEVNL